MFRQMPIAAIPLHSIYIVVSYLEGALCDGPTLADPYRNKRQTKMEDFFLRLLCFWDKKLTKPGQSQSEKLCYF